MTVKLTSFLTRLIEAITDARDYEHEKWHGSDYFQALDSCLEEAHELLHFELTRSPASHRENKLQVSPDVGQRRVTRQTTAKLMKRKMTLPDEVLNVIFSYFKDSRHNPTNLSSNAYNFSLVCKSWHRVANRRLWHNIHLSTNISTILFARSLHERRRQKGLPLSIGDDIRGLHVHLNAKITFPASVTYVLDCANLFTRNIVSLNLHGLSTFKRPMKITQFYEIIKHHPYLKHVWLCEVVMDSIEPLDPLPQLETCACSNWWPYPEGKTLELISAKTIHKVSVFKKDAVKSVYSSYSSLFKQQAHELKHLTHLYSYLFYNESFEDLRHIVQLPNLSFLVLDNSSYRVDISFDLIAKHCSLTTFVINWQPSEDSLDSWRALIKTLGPKLLSVGIGLEGEKHVDHPCILQTIYKNCPNLMTLELYGKNSPNDAWPLQSYTSELENLCRLPLKWIYAPWFKKWPQNWKDSCPNFAKLCLLGVDAVLNDLPFGHRKLLDYNQPMRPAIVGDDLW